MYGDVTTHSTHSTHFSVRDIFLSQFLKQNELQAKYDQMAKCHYPLKWPSVPHKLKLFYLDVL